MTTLSRRRVLGLAAAGAGGLAVASAAPALGAGAGDGADFVAADQDLHLLRRATFGPTPALLSQIRKQGRRKWLDRQLDPASIDDHECSAFIKERLPRVLWSIPEARDRLEPFSWDLMFELTAATIARA